MVGVDGAIEVCGRRRKRGVPGRGGGDEVGGDDDSGSSSDDGSDAGKGDDQGSGQQQQNLLDPRRYNQACVQRCIKKPRPPKRVECVLKWAVNPCTGCREAVIVRRYAPPPDEEDQGLMDEEGYDEGVPHPDDCEFIAEPLTPQFIVRPTCRTMQVGKANSLSSPDGVIGQVLALQQEILKQQQIMSSRCAMPMGGGSPLNPAAAMSAGADDPFTQLMVATLGLGNSPVAAHNPQIPAPNPQTVLSHLPFPLRFPEGQKGNMC